MKSRKFYLGMLVLVLAFVMTLVGCGGGDSGPNNFVGKKYTFTNVDNSILIFDQKTWTWDGVAMKNANGVPTVYNFRGNYTCSNGGNTATMISTDFAYGSSAWTPWAYKWTATLDANGRITVTGVGAVKSIISIDEPTVELEGYQVR